MITVKYKFAIGDRVVINDLKISGNVIALFTGEYGNQYYVMYFYDGGLKKEYLFDFQIASHTNGKHGFLTEPEDE